MKSPLTHLISLGVGSLHAMLCAFALTASAQPSGAPAAPTVLAAPSGANATSDASKSATPIRVTQPSPAPLLTDRLFFSEDERTRLDRARARGVSTDELDAGISLAPTLDGVVRQVGGRTTYWVNGTPRVVAPKAREPIVPNAMIGPELKAEIVDHAAAGKAETKPPRRGNRDTSRPSSPEKSAR